MQVIVLIALVQHLVSPDCARIRPNGSCVEEDGSQRRKVIGLVIFEIVVAIVRTRPHLPHHLDCNQVCCKCNQCWRHVHFQEPNLPIDATS